MLQQSQAEEAGEPLGARREALLRAVDVVSEASIRKQGQGSTSISLKPGSARSDHNSNAIKTQGGNHSLLVLCSMQAALVRSSVIDVSLQPSQKPDVPKDC